MTESEKLKQRSTNIQKKLAKMIHESDHIAALLDANEGTLPHLIGSDRVRKQMSSRFKVLIRRIETGTAELQKIVNRQAELKALDDG